jgi:hypothetical protein
MDYLKPYVDTDAILAVGLSIDAHLQSSYKRYLDEICMVYKLHYGLIYVIREWWIRSIDPFTLQKKSIFATKGVRRVFLDCMIHT